MWQQPKRQSETIVATAFLIAKKYHVTFLSFLKSDLYAFGMYPSKIRLSLKDTFFLNSFHSGKLIS